MISQSSYIAAFLVIGFIVFITMRGELTAYRAVIGVQMPFAFIIVGLVLLISGVRNTTGNLTTLVKGDFTGSRNFFYWMLAILIIGALGYIKPIQPLSRMFLVLVIIVLFLSNKGVFASFNSQLFSNAPSSPSTTSSTSGIAPLSTSSLLSMNDTNSIPIL